MAFENQNQNQNSGPRNGNGKSFPPLTRLGGLYNSKNGNALTGNIRVDMPRQGSEVPFGDELIDLIRQAMDQRVPVRLLVFENNGKYGQKAPYTAHVSLGDRPYDATAGETSEEAPARRPQYPTYPTPQTVSEPTPEPDWVTGNTTTSGYVSEAPRRRTAPRR